MKTGIPEIDSSDATVIVGCDEVGYGSWAGPLVVCAVAVPKDWHDPRVKDSKAYKSKRDLALREALHDEYIGSTEIVISMQVMDSEVVDQHGVYKAAHICHEEAIRGTFFRLVYDPLIVVDGTTAPKGFQNAIAIPKADAKVPAVSLASVLAKVHRDRMMRGLDDKYPGYGFASNVGYCSPSHDAGLKRLGPCPIHRRSFAPIAKMLEPKRPATPYPWEFPEDLIDEASRVE